jgi:hypothetical protein
MRGRRKNWVWREKAMRQERRLLAVRYDMVAPRMRGAVGKCMRLQGFTIVYIYGNLGPWPWQMYYHLDKIGTIGETTPLRSFSCNILIRGESLIQEHKIKLSTYP